MAVTKEGNLPANVFFPSVLLLLLLSLLRPWSLSHRDCGAVSQFIVRSDTPRHL